MMAVAALILTTIVALSYREWTEYGRARADTIRLREVQNSLNHLTSHVLDAETGQRGFLLTGEERYLEPYNRAIRDIPADLASLKSLLGPQSQPRMLPRLNSLMLWKVSLSEQALKEFEKARPKCQMLR